MNITEKILILDGAMGTLIQSQNLTPDDFGGYVGCNDYLNITRADVIEQIHAQYFDAGADIVSTNTFNANAVSLADYGLQDQVYRINYEAVRIARRAASGVPGRYIAGSVGPTSKSLSMSPRVEEPAFRSITFEELAQAYAEQIRGLIDAGVDVILLETVFDTLNAKAAIFAVREILASDIDIMVSGTITDQSGRTLSGQTIEAFYESVKHGRLLTIGLNCAFGARQLKSYVGRLARIAECGISAHPNAGLPNVMGGYDESAQQMALIIEEYLRDGMINIIGGCCGTTPEHIREIAKIRDRYCPREIIEQSRVTTLSGLEPLYITRDLNFVNVGERSNVAGSAKFARLIREQKFQQALDVVIEQVEAGASIIDVCMDAPMIEAGEAMTQFLNLMASEPDISRLPVMIDSSSWEVLEAGLRTQQGKAVVNSISLKEGETEFLRRARLIRNYGAAAVVMLFDERGQADVFDRKIEVAGRAYNLLISNGFAAEDIIFDPNVLSVATGIAEHDGYGLDFIRACEWIKANCPGVKISGGVSNLSFSFRGNNMIREAMHSVFLYHAIAAGMDMGIVNPAMLQIYDEITNDLRELVEDVVMNRVDGATERLIEYAAQVVEKKSGDTESQVHEELPTDEKIVAALVRGSTATIESDVLRAYETHGSALEVIDQVLMVGMSKVGELFSTGKMFLPQVVKSARVMKQAVKVLEPYILVSKTEQQNDKTIVFATVRGDVHDIGKNIVSIVLQCNGYKVIDLGVMVPPEAILQAVREYNPRIVALSGLITPSLEQMRVMAELFQNEGLDIPICVGGATTSALHTAVKIAPSYDTGLVAHSGDASAAVNLVNSILGNKDFMREYKDKQQKIREKYEAQQVVITPLAKARQMAPKQDFSALIKPRCVGKQVFKKYSLAKIATRIDWNYLFAEWGIAGRYPDIFDHPTKGVEARRLWDDAQEMLERVIAGNLVEANAVLAIVPARGVDDDILVGECECCTVRLPQLRNQTTHYRSLADYVAPSGDYIVPFALGVNNNANFEDDYQQMMSQILCDRMAEAFAEEISEIIRIELWGFENEGLRVGVGYPTAPEHSVKQQIFELLDVENEIPLRITDNYVMQPTSAVSGLIFAHPEAEFFSVGIIGEDQIEDYAKRSGLSQEKIKVNIPNNVR